MLSYLSCFNIIHLNIKHYRIYRFKFHVQFIRAKNGAVI